VEYWRDYKTNEEILKELRVTSVLDKITSYRSDWIQHVNRLPRSRLPNSLTELAPRGIRNQGTQLKRLLEERDRNRPAIYYFPEGEMMMMMTLRIRSRSVNHPTATFGYFELQKSY
jgi:hypothetical protein